MQHPPPRGKRRNRKGGKGDDAQRKRNTGTRPEVGGEIISPTKLNEKKTDNPVNNLEAELEFEDPYPDELDEEDLKMMQATQEGMEKMEEGEEEEDGDVEFRDPDDEDENLPAPKVLAYPVFCYSQLICIRFGDQALINLATMKSLNMTAAPTICSIP